ncbi:MAG: hypothetical protein ACJAUP_001211 [Cellvibrionaceae bacterium]|jgi:hypothetical protein
MSSHRPKPDQKSGIPPPELTSHLWQAAFVESLFNGFSEPLISSLMMRPDTRQQARFAVYQNNVFYSLRTALADLYPTIKTLVGEAFFNGTADAYIRIHPPKQASMVYFGLHFSEFLSHFEHTRDMPYLVDIALLELAHHQAYHAADIDILDKVFFASIEPSVFEHSGVKFHPSLQIVSSAFPIFTIWQSNQTEAPSSSSENSSAKINLDEPQWLIVVRLDYEVLVFNVDYGTYLFYHYLFNGKPINNAAQRAQNKHADVDISSAIVLGINNGFFTALNP